MKMSKHIFVFLLIVFPLVNSNALARQDKFAGEIIRTKAGVLLVCNEPNNYYTLEIKGGTILPAFTEPTVFIVDDKLLQILTTPIRSFILDEVSLKQADEKFILTAYKDREVRQIEAGLNEQLNVESSWRKLSNGMEALLWEYDVRAGPRRNVKKNIYMSVVKGDFILTLSAPVRAKDNEAGVRQMLIETLSTLKPSDKPIDLQEVRKAVRRGKS